MMQHFFQSWGTFSSEIKAASHVLLLADCDGTLTPIVQKPEEALLAPAVREKIGSLSEKPAFSVGIISGRSLAELRGMVRLGNIYYAGNHGLEIEGPGINFILPEAETARADIGKLAAQLSEKLGGIKGVIVEDKGLSLSVHYRMVKPAKENSVYRIFQRVTAPLLAEGKIRITSGKKVWEVRPPIEWHKGNAVELISHKIEDMTNCHSLPVIYLGDDATDEDAFKAVLRHAGWGIFIGDGAYSSEAEYFLNSTAEVADFLSRLDELK